MARRANGEGTVYRLPSGKWRVIVTARVAGHLERKSGIRQKHADALVLRDKLRAELYGGQSRDTVSAYLKQWLATSVKPNVAMHTFLSYERAVRLHIVPRVGTIKLAKVSPTDVEQFKVSMAEAKVGPRAAQLAFDTLRVALGQAVYPLKILSANPCDGIKKPRHARKKMLPFEAAEVRDILKESEDSRWHAFYSVAFGCGLRAGELFGLQWTDIDLPSGTLRVERQALDASGRIFLEKPKTKSSIRTVSLPEFARKGLRNHRAIQMREGNARCEFVFPTLKGSLVCRSNFYADEWRPRLIRLGLKHRGLHNTRHTFATLALLNGVPVAVVSKALGHSSPAITMQVYSHCLPSMETAAATTLGQLLG